MPGRNARQCKDRWEKYLNPDINFQPFTQEEDRMRKNVTLESLNEMILPEELILENTFLDETHFDSFLDTIDFAVTDSF